MIISGLKFICTCQACPEQYDVIDNTGNMVGYVRLRFGRLTCDYPDVGGEKIYCANIGNEWCGIFPDDEQRDYHLRMIANKILEIIYAKNINKGKK